MNTMRKLVIKGAIYTDGALLMRPLYTGEFFAVDCNVYLPLSEIRETYDPQEVDAILDAEKLELNGVMLYKCEKQICDTSDMTLLVDLEHFEYKHTGFQKFVYTP